MVAVTAYRSRPVVRGRTNSHADRDVLRTRRSCSHQRANGQQSKIFKITHFFVLGSSRTFVQIHQDLPASRHPGFIRCTHLLELQTGEKVADPLIYKEGENFSPFITRNSGISFVDDSYQKPL